MGDKNTLIQPSFFFILRPHHQTFVFRWLRIYFYEPWKNRQEKAIIMDREWTVTQSTSAGLLHHENINTRVKEKMFSLWWTLADDETNKIASLKSALFHMLVVVNTWNLLFFMLAGLQSTNKHERTKENVDQHLKAYQVVWRLSQRTVWFFFFKWHFLSVGLFVRR